MWFEVQSTAVNLGQFELRCTHEYEGGCLEGDSVLVLCVLL